MLLTLIKFNHADVHQAQDIRCFDDPFPVCIHLICPFIVSLDFIFVYAICLCFLPIHGLSRRVNTPHEIDADSNNDLKEVILSINTDVLK